MSMQEKIQKMGWVVLLEFGSVGRVWNMGLGLRFGEWCGVVWWLFHVAKL